MSRDWIAAYTAMLGKPKYRRTSPVAKGALLHVWLLAGQQAPEATWPHRGELAEILELDGFPPDVLDELLDRRWLDVDPAGRILVHDWDDHQLAATRAIGHAYEADRLRAWRRKKKADGPDDPDAVSPPVPPSSVPNTTGLHDITSQDSNRSTYPVRTRTYAPPPAEPQPTNGRDLTTCPSCGDGPLEDTDVNVAVERDRQRWHRECPTAEASA